MDYKVYITNKIPAAALEMLTKVAQVHQWTEDIALPYEVLAEKTRDIDGLLCLLIDTIDARIIKSARRLKVISTFAVGYDNIDTAQATRSLSE